MAPNTKQLNLLVQQLSPADLTLAKPHFAPLTQAAPQQEPVDSDSYWAETTEVRNETDCYWDWSENPKKDILSGNHIALNLVKSHKVKTDLIRSGVDSASYWDTTSAKDAEPVTAQHINEEATESYWEWSADPDSRQAIIDTIMKDEAARQMLAGDHIANNIRKASSDMYWNTDAEMETHEDSTKYWEFPSSNNQAVAASGNDYWVM
eukprot:CAMPEP_0119011898 /NCGR_PEP_ID=MMETSP1176-20130426/5950_1 /TAXON_ID=265551 /ORGANISM="Synedropsis recta cf, Strain CCMP1620" /LENGTH=206 /DNA_ID=CAMNT_0006964775 /DNA_START=73 /DNA_END=693 /DNA_ORIENTATION=-